MKKLPKKTHKLLGALANYLDHHANKIEKHFNMDAWFYHEGDESFEDEHGVEASEKIPSKKLFSCGTTACALGWACQVPALKSMGLYLQYDGNETGSVRLKDCTARDEFTIAQKIFDLSRGQAAWLFTPLNANTYEDDRHNETPKEWAARCRLFLGIEGDTRNVALPR